VEDILVLYGSSAYSNVVGGIHVKDELANTQVSACFLNFRLKVRT
jgi:hypothetical protein